MSFMVAFQYAVTILRCQPSGEYDETFRQNVSGECGEDAGHVDAIKKAGVSWNEIA